MNSVELNPKEEVLIPVMIEGWNELEEIEDKQLKIKKANDAVYNMVHVIPAITLLKLVEKGFHTYKDEQL